MIWVLTIDWAGTRWAWASGSLPDGAGASVVRRMEGPGWAWDAPQAGDPPAPPDGVSLELAWPEVAALEAEGHRLESAVAELAVLQTGDAWADRDVVYQGPIVGGEYGGPGEAVALQLRPAPWEDSGLLLQPSQQVGEDTWAIDGSEGRGYPLVIGKPGVYQRSDGTSDTLSGAPCLPVGGDLLVVACHRVAATSLEVYSPTDDASETFAISYQFDDAGQQVAVVDLSAAATIFSDTSYSYYGIWEDGGLSLEDGTPLETAGEVIAWALRQSSLEVDAAALAAIQAPLAGFRLAGFIDAPCSPWDWLQREVLPLLPVALLQGPRGIRPALWRPPSASLATDSLSVDRGEVARDGRITRIGNPLNDMTIRYAWSARTGQYYRSRRRAAGGNICSEVAQRSAEMLGPKVGPTLETQWVYDLLTADRILLSQMEMRQPRRQVALVGTLSRLRFLRPLDCVLFSSSALALSDIPAIVRRVEWGAVDARLILEF